MTSFAITRNHHEASRQTRLSKYGSGCVEKSRWIPRNQKSAPKVINLFQDACKLTLLAGEWYVSLALWQTSLSWGNTYVGDKASNGHRLFCFSKITDTIVLYRYRLFQNQSRCLNAIVLELLSANGRHGWTKNKAVCKSIDSLHLVIDCTVIRTLTVLQEHLGSSLTVANPCSQLRRLNKIRDKLVLLQNQSL